jgi:hypothetical protein
LATESKSRGTSSLIKIRETIFGKYTKEQLDAAALAST